MAKLKTRVDPEEVPFIAQRLSGTNRAQVVMRMNIKSSPEEAGHV